MPERKPSKTFLKVEAEAQEVDAALGRLNSLTAVFEKSKTQTALEVGAILAAAQKKLSKYGEGVFIRWIQERLKLKKTRAYQWLRLHEFFGNCPQCVQSIDVSALYILATDSGPDYKAALGDALALAETGKRVSRQTVIRILQAYRDEALQRIREARRSGEWDAEFDIDEVPEVPGELTAYQELKTEWSRATVDERRQFEDWVKRQTLARRRSAKPKVPEPDPEPARHDGWRTFLRQEFRDYLQTLDTFELEVLGATFDHVIEAFDTDLRMRVEGSYEGPYYLHRQEATGIPDPRVPPDAPVQPSRREVRKSARAVK